MHGLTAMQLCDDAIKDIAAGQLHDLIEQRRTCVRSHGADQGVSESLATIDEIGEDLAYLEQAFAEFRIDPKRRVISATTGPIVLEGVELGPFSIDLSLRQMADASRANMCTITALDAHPAAEDPLVTHPHVNAGHLCSGDATVPIRNALDAGRIGDVFLLVRAVLSHYNPDSPFVPLEQWRGEPCRDCGLRVSGDLRYDCAGCGHIFCAN